MLYLLNQSAYMLFLFFQFFSNLAKTFPLRQFLFYLFCKHLLSPLFSGLVSFHT